MIINIFLLEQFPLFRHYLFKHSMFSTEWQEYVDESAFILHDIVIKGDFNCQ